MDATQQLLNKFENLTITNDEKVLLKTKADQAYFNGEKEIMNDSCYDTLIEDLKANGYYDNAIGCTPPITGKVSLPLWMGSMDKIKDDKKCDGHIKQWLKKITPHCRFVLQYKLDGVSCLLVKKKHSKIEAYTRGNGDEGTNITHLLPYILVGNIDNEDEFALRCEIMITKSTFQLKYLAAAEKKFSNPRTFVSAVCNRNKDNTIPSEVKDLRIVAYEFISLDAVTGKSVQPKISDQLQLLKRFNSMGIETVHSLYFDGELSKTLFTDTLCRFRKESEFEMDGIVIVANIPYIRNTTGNPKHSIAFKTKGCEGDDNVKEAEVTFVEWNVGKTGVLNPKVHIVPTKIDGTTVTCFTGFNANYLMENGIGKGAIVLVTRAGNAIPQIIGVKKSGHVIFPKEYEWKGDCRIVQKRSSKDRTVNEILHFIKEVQVPHIGKATVSTLYDNGCVSVEHFLKLSQKDLISFGPIKSGIIYDSIQKAFEASVENFLSGFSAFDNYIGGKKIALILQKYPSIFEMDDINELDLLKVEGIGSKTAEQIKQSFPNAKYIYGLLSKYIKHREEPPRVKKSDIVVCMSGTRDSMFLKDLKERNIILSDSMTKKVNILIVKCKDSDPTSKVKKALEMGTTVMTVDQFKCKYF